MNRRIADFSPVIEVMLRLFFMSLIAFIFHKLFGKKQDKPTVEILSVANVIAAILFAAGHLPATFMMIGNFPIILARCFLLNGGIGLLFGWLYRKYGLRYSMIAHSGCHVVSKLIWILFTPSKRSVLLWVEKFITLSTIWQMY